MWAGQYNNDKNTTWFKNLIQNVFIIGSSLSWERQAAAEFSPGSYSPSVFL